jgi:hypothetical protein
MEPNQHSRLQPPERKGFLKNYSLSIVLGLLFLVSWVGQWITGWKEFVAEQLEHGQTAQLFGDDGYVWAFGKATFENWQSEFLQLLTFVVLTTYLIHKGSHESKDEDEKVDAQLNRIEKKLTELQAAQRGVSSTHDRDPGGGGGHLPRG